MDAIDLIARPPRTFRIEHLTTPDGDLIDTRRVMTTRESAGGQWRQALLDATREGREVWERRTQSPYIPWDGRHTAWRV